MGERVGVYIATTVGESGWHEHVACSEEKGCGVCGPLPLGVSKILDKIKVLESALLSARATVIEECAGAMCDLCRQGNKSFETMDEGGSYCFVHGGSLLGWRPCNADDIWKLAIRAKLAEGANNDASAR